MASNFLRNSVNDGRQ